MADKFCAACGRKVALNAQFCAGCGAALGAKERNVQKERILGIIGAVIPIYGANGARLKEPPTLSMIFADTQVIFLHMESPKDHSGKAKITRALTAGVAQMVYDGYRMHEAGKTYGEFANAIQTYDPNELLLSDERNYAIPYSDIEKIDIKRPRLSTTWGARTGDLNIIKRHDERSAAPITLTFKLAYVKTTKRRIEAEDTLLAQLQSSILSGKLFVRQWSR